MAPLIPHLALPLRLRGSSLAAVEQDTPEEVATAVEVVLRYTPGDFDVDPAFGTPSQLFRQGGADVQEILDAVARYEPRVDALVTEDDSELRDLISRVRVDVTITTSEA